MGDILKILDEKQIGDGIYNNEAHLEIQEMIHFHYKDLRLFFNKDNFLKVCDLFEQAKKKYLEIGTPEFTEDMISLSNIEFSSKNVGNRLGIEVQKDGTVHIHYNDLRLHLNMGDLLVWFNVFENAANNLPQSLVQEVTINKCWCHEVVDDYVKYLKESCSDNDEESVNSIKIKKIKLETKVQWGDYFKRNLGFIEPKKELIPKDLDLLYLTSVFQSIKKYGYAQGPYLNKYLVVYKNVNGRPYILNAHRLAALITLGYEKIKVYMVDKETNWVG